ncbi:MAG: sigma-70 family RNA polymerase sigma factor [Burkholderiales bacterium]|nr:sigma-70 family RNA polymerase sigma factor [Opitutaceae bacterium]
MISLSDSITGACGSKAETKTERTKKSRVEADHDECLVARFKGGDETAFTEIVARYRTRLFSVALSRVWNRGDAEEIVQDAFIRSHRGLATYRGECSLATWLHHITLNLARNRYWYFHRRFRHATVSLDCPVGEDDSSTILDTVACDSAGPRREAVTHEFMDLIAVCMQRLDEPQRKILTLTHTLGYSEIAERLGINLGTVKSRIARARDRLHALLTEACPEFANGTRPAAWLESARAPQAGATSTLNQR